MKSIKLYAIIAFAFIYTSMNAQHTSNSGIKWMSIHDAIKANTKTKKKMLVDFYTDWCGWCKKMDASTYEDPKVAKYMNEHFYAVKFNAENETPFKFNGKEFKMQINGNRGTHEFAIDQLEGKMGYPSTAFIQNDLSKIFVVPGYITADEFLSILHYVNEEGYKKQPYEEFKKTYKPE